MDVISAMISRVQTFNDGLTDGTYMSDIIKKYDYVIIDMNAELQLYEQGINRVGVSISDYMPYTPKTIEIKEIKGQPTDRVTLRDTGDFHSSFKVVTSREGFLITAEDWKTEHLVKKYGRQILGLTDENAQELNEEYILPELLETARKVILNA